MSVKEPQETKWEKSAVFRLYTGLNTRLTATGSHSRVRAMEGDLRWGLVWDKTTEMGSL